MQEQYTNTPESFEGAALFGTITDDAAESGQHDAMPCIQIVHFDETDKPAKTKTVPLSFFLQSDS